MTLPTAVIDIPFFLAVKSAAGGAEWSYLVEVAAVGMASLVGTMMGKVIRSTINKPKDGGAAG